MHKFSMAYAKFINAKYEESGSLFQGPFKSQVVLTDEYLRYLATYVMVKNSLELYPEGGLSGAMQDFDKAYEFVVMALLNTRKTTQDITKLFSEHAQRVARGEVARMQGPNLYIDENIDKELRKHTEDFLNGAVRVLKQGMQDVTKALQVNIGFLFKKPGTFETGVEALQLSDANLAEYLRRTRQWSERLVQFRNAMEHTGSVLPKLKYSRTSSAIHVEEPNVSGQPLSEFVRVMFDRLACFVEEVSAHCLQQRLPEGITITELPLAQRDPEKPERFRLTLKDGGLSVWTITYHETPFEET